MKPAPTNYMGQLDQWVDEAVIQPLFAVWQGQRETEHDEISYKGVELTTYGVRRAIREKVLESYHNGQKARPKGFQRSIRRR